MIIRTLAAVLAGALAAAAATVGAGPSTWTGDLSPITASDWNYDRAAYLLERAGFSGTPAEIQALAEMTPQQAVRHLVRYQNVQDVNLPPFRETGIFPSPEFSLFGEMRAFTVVARGTVDRMSPEERAKVLDDKATGVTEEMKRVAKNQKQAITDAWYYYNYADRLETARLQTWILDRALKTRRPLQEKLVLFWHGHFATGNEKIYDYRKMMGQFSMLRDHANGNLRDLLIGIGKDPAMLVYLDNRQNVKDHPNENFAREILELFSLGVGNYTEKDIKEAARAFTGWSLDDHGVRFQNRPALHDEGQKTFLGKTGNFTGEDIVDIVLQQPACPHFISRKLYRFFVRDNFSRDFEDKLAATLVEDKFEMAPFLETIFLSKDFYSPAAYGKQIKSPVQLVISTYRKLGVQDAPTYPAFNQLTGQLGQTIFYPPNVKGWDGGKTWINPATIFERDNVARYILFPEQMPYDPQSYLEGSKRLSGENIHNQFLAMAAKGNYTDFPDTGTGMMGGGMAMKGAPGEEAAKLSSEERNVFRGVFNGSVFAHRNVPPDPRKVPDFHLAAMLRQENVSDAAGAVDSLMKRFLRLPIAGQRRADIVRFCEQQIGSSKIDYSRFTLEKDLREVLHLILSAPEYQVS